MDGSWLVRIEDIDPPREVPGSADSILQALDALDLHWDGDVRYQSTRVDDYLTRALELVESGQAYYCSCSRQDIRALTRGTRYPGTCRNRRLRAGDTSIRLRTDAGTVEFVDRLQGRIERNIETDDGDFVIVRRDRLPAYHLAVVIDDADQQITDVVRGGDLLDCTPLHILLQRRLDLPTPNYWHIPVITDADGEKLSKSSGATPVDTANAAQTAAAALELLGLDLPTDLNGAPPKTLWKWAERHWRIDAFVERRYS